MGVVKTKTFNVSLDLKGTTAQRDEWEVVEGDNGNILIVTLTDNGTPVDLTGCRVFAVFGLPDGRTVEQDTVEGSVTIGGTNHNVITIQLKTGSFAPGKGGVGLMKAEIEVYSGDDYSTRVTSAQFTFQCRRAIMNDDTVEASNEYPILVQLIEQTADAIQALDDAWTAKVDIIDGKVQDWQDTIDGWDGEVDDAVDALEDAWVDEKAIIDAQIITWGDQIDTALQNRQADWNENDSTKLSYIKNKPAIVGQVQADWNEADNTQADYIKNKPTIPSAPVQSDWNENDNTSLAYIANKPSIPAAQIQSDWNQADTTKLDYIKNKPASMPPTSHNHGRISSSGELSQDFTAASGDKLVLADASDNGKIIRSGITIGSATNKWLNESGAWSTPTATDVGAMPAGSTPTPAAHASSHATGGTDEITPASIGAMAAGATPTPAAHASSHATGGSDEITPASIGAAAASALSGYIPTTDKGAASGVATLNANTKVTATQASALLIEVTANKTLTATDAGTFQQVNSSSAITITIPDNTGSTIFPANTEIEFARWNTGTVTFAGDTGVTICSVGSKLSIADRYGCVLLRRGQGDNTWLLAGDLG